MRVGLQSAIWRAVQLAMTGAAGSAEEIATGVLPPPEWSAPQPVSAKASFVGMAAWGHVLAELVRRSLSGRLSDIPGRQSFATWALSRLGVELVVEGLSNIPADGGGIVMWNQESHLEHFVMTAMIDRPVISLYNNEVAATPFYGEFLRRSGHIHIDRHDEAQWRPALARGAERVRRGEWLVVSPEGTRSWTGELLAMKRGAFILARAAQRPVVCATIVGAGACLPRTAFTVRPGRISVSMSKPIEVADDALDLEQIVSRTFREEKARIGAA